MRREKNHGRQNGKHGLSGSDFQNGIPPPCFSNNFWNRGKRHGERKVSRLVRRNFQRDLCGFLPNDFTFCHMAVLNRSLDSHRNYGKDLSCIFKPPGQHKRPGVQSGSNIHVRKLDLAGRNPLKFQLPFLSILPNNEPDSPKHDHQDHPQNATQFWQIRRHENHD